MSEYLPHDVPEPGEAVSPKLSRLKVIRFFRPTPASPPPRSEELAKALSEFQRICHQLKALVHGADLGLEPPPPAKHAPSGETNPAHIISASQEPPP